MRLGPEDILVLGFRYVPSFIVSVLVSIAMLFGLQFIARNSPNFDHWGAIRVCLTFGVLVCWIIYVLVTYQLRYTVVMLGSESSKAAEWAYENRFKSQVRTLQTAVRLATNPHEEPNVRFYAACLIADKIVTNNEVETARILQNLHEGPPIITQFFDGNNLTEGFYVPGREQVQLSAADVVGRRLQLPRSRSENKK